LNEIEHNAAGGQPHYFFSNHDQPRQWDRYGDGAHNDQIAKLTAALLLTTRATPLMYYGEEIGMRTTEPARKEDVQDPIGKIGWPEEKGRDGERTPMQWTARQTPASARRSALGCPCRPALPHIMSRPNRRTPTRFCLSTSACSHCAEASPHSGMDSICR